MLFRFLILVCLSISLASCSVSSVKSVSDFKENWESSKNNSAVSWWYVGESDYAYFVTEKYPLRHYSYELPKTGFVLKGVSKMEPCKACKACKGVNLKAGQVIYRDQ